MEQHCWTQLPPVWARLPVLAKHHFFLPTVHQNRQPLACLRKPPLRQHLLQVTARSCQTCWSTGVCLACWLPAPFCTWVDGPQFCCGLFYSCTLGRILLGYLRLAAPHVLISRIFRESARFYCWFLHKNMVGFSQKYLLNLTIFFATLNRLV